MLQKDAPEYFVLIYGCILYALFRHAGRAIKGTNFLQVGGEMAMPEERHLFLKRSRGVEPKLSTRKPEESDGGLTQDLGLLFLLHVR